MTDKEIKAMFSVKILQMEDKAAEMTLRRMLFGTNNKIDWQDAYRMAIYEMPELKNWRLNDEEERRETA